MKACSVDQRKRMGSILFICLLSMSWLARLREKLRLVVIDLKFRFGASVGLMVESDMVSVFLGNG